MMKRLNLIEVNHPGHIHLFRNLYYELEKRNNKSLFLIKSDKIIRHLADLYSLPYISLGKKGNGILEKYIKQIVFFAKVYFFAKKMNAKIGIGVSMTLPFVSKFIKMDSISLDDDDMSATPVFAKYANKADVILTPNALSFEKRGKNHLTYSGYHELAYLHPKRFKPDPDIWRVLGVEEGTKFFVLRFNSFLAHHDGGERGLSLTDKKRLVNKLKKRGAVFVLSESEICSEFSEYELKISPDKIHSVLWFATMFVGDSQTMTTEAAILGTPALKCNTFAGRLSIPNELEKKYGLCFSYHPSEFKNLESKMDELLNYPELKQEWQKRRQKMLNDKIDVTAFLVWFVENYPESFRIMKEDPDYQYRFK